MAKIPVRGIHTTSKESDFSRSFNIRDLQTLLGGRDKIEELHRHDHFFILTLEKGAGSHSVDFTHIPLSNHSLFFIRPGQVHELVLKAKSTGYLLKFKPGLHTTQDKTFSQMLRKASRINHYELTATGFKKVLPLLSAIYQEYTARQEGYEVVIKSNLSILFIELTRQNNRDVGENGNVYAQERLEKLQDLLEAHIATHKQVAQYADMLNLSAYQLNAITKSTLGKTCSDLINEQIILESKRHLLATSDQVSQVADDLGYEDTSYFIRFFKKHTGYSPEAFRQKFK